MSRVGIFRAFVAGFFGTIAMTILMLLKTKAGWMPELDPIGMIVQSAHTKMGLPDAAWVGWVIHFFIGTIFWPFIYAFVSLALPGPGIVKGLIFGVLAWLVFMLVAMPMSGGGFFGINVGPMAWLPTLILHLVYGFFLGWLYALMMRKKA